jgi:hypothetical protein
MIGSLGAIATAGLGAAQLGYGLYQQSKNKRPTYEIPPEIKANMTLAQQQALQGLPEEQKQQFINNTQRSQAFSMSQLGSRKAGLSGVAAINQQGQDAYGNLMAQDAQARMQNQNKLYAANQTMADYKDQAFQLNESNLYYEKTAQNNAMMGAGIQNLTGGLLSTNFGKKKPQLQTQPPQMNVQTDPYQARQIYSTDPTQPGEKMNMTGYSGGSIWG